MKLLLYILSSFLFLSCTSSQLQSDRLPAFDQSQQTQALCEKNLVEIKENLILKMQNQILKLHGEVNKQIFEKQNDYQFECVTKLPNSFGYRIDKKLKKIFIESELKSAETLFDTALAKSHVGEKQIELRAITFDILKSATVLQAMYDYSIQVDVNMNYYFEYIKFIQAN